MLRHGMSISLFISGRIPTKRLPWKPQSSSLRRALTTLPNPSLVTQDWVNTETWRSKYRVAINDLMEAIAGDKAVKERTRAKMIDSANWESYLNTVRRHLVKDPVNFCGNQQELLERMQTWLQTWQRGQHFDTVPQAEEFEAKRNRYKDAFFEIIFAKAVVDLKPISDANLVLATTSDLTVPHEWYPLARMFRRKIIYHGGPTNSGKVRMNQ